MAVMYHSATPMRTASPPRVRRKEIVLLERALELGDEVVHVLDAVREAYQAVVDAEVGAHALGQRGVGHDRRVLDQALDPAEAFGEGEELAALQEPARGG